MGMFYDLKEYFCVRARNVCVKQMQGDVLSFKQLGFNSLCARLLVGLSDQFYWQCRLFFPGLGHI